MKYKEVFRLHIEPHFGSKRLDEIKRKHVKHFIGTSQRQGTTLRPGTQVILAVLSGIFENAIEDEIISIRTLPENHGNIAELAG